MDFLVKYFIILIFIVSSNILSANDINKYQLAPKSFVLVTSQEKKIIAQGSNPLEYILKKLKIDKSAFLSKEVTFEETEIDDELNKLTFDEIEAIFPSSTSIIGNADLVNMEIKSVIMGDKPFTFCEAKGDWVKDFLHVAHSFEIDSIIENPNENQVQIIKMFKTKKKYPFNFSYSKINDDEVRIYYFNPNQIENILSQEEDTRIAYDGIFGIKYELWDAFFTNEFLNFGKYQMRLWGLSLSDIDNIDNEDISSSTFEPYFNTLITSSQKFDKFINKKLSPEHILQTFNTGLNFSSFDFRFMDSGFTQSNGERDMRMVYGEFGRGREIANESLLGQQIAIQAMNNLDLVDINQLSKSSVESYKKAIEKVARSVFGRKIKCTDTALSKMLNRLMACENQMFFGTDEFSFTVEDMRNKKDDEDGESLLEIIIEPKKRILTIKQNGDDIQRKFQLSDDFDIFHTRLSEIKIVTKDGYKNPFLYSIEKQWMPSEIDLSNVLQNSFVVEFQYMHQISRNDNKEEIQFLPVELGSKSFILSIQDGNKVKWNKTVGLTREQNFAQAYGGVENLSTLGGNLIFSIGHTHPETEGLNFEKRPKHHAGDIRALIQKMQQLGKPIGDMVVETLIPKKKFLFRFFVPKTNLKYNEYNLENIDPFNEIENNIEDYFEIEEVVISIPETTKKNNSEVTEQLINMVTINPDNTKVTKIHSQLIVGKKPQKMTIKHLFNNLLKIFRSS